MAAALHRLPLHAAVFRDKLLKSADKDVHAEHRTQLSGSIVACTRFANQIRTKL